MQMDERFLNEIFSFDFDENFDCNIYLFQIIKILKYFDAGDSYLLLGHIFCLLCKKFRFKFCKC